MAKRKGLASRIGAFILHWYGPQLKFLLVFLSILCVILTYIAVVFFADYKTIEAEPVIVGDFPLQQVWQIELYDYIASPIAVWENKVYVRAGRNLYALSVQAPSFLWELTGMEYVGQQMVFAQDGWVVTRQSEDSIVVVDARTGAIRISIPDLTDKGNLYAGAVDEHSLYAVLRRSLRIYDLENGAARFGTPQNGGYVAEAKNVFLNSQAQELYLITFRAIDIFDPETGKPKTSSIRFADGLESHPLYDPVRNELFMGRGGKLDIFNLSTRTMRLSVNTGKFLFSPTLIGETLYLVNEAGEIIIIDVLSGEIQQRYTLSDAPSLLETPGVLGDYLYTRDQRTGRIYAINLSTQRVVSGYIQSEQSTWKDSSQGIIYPVVVDGRLIFTQGARIYAYAPPDAPPPTPTPTPTSTPTSAPCPTPTDTSTPLPPTPTATRVVPLEYYHTPTPASPSTP